MIDDWFSQTAGRHTGNTPITATRQYRAFSIVGPSIWNGLPPLGGMEVCLLPKNSVFYRLLKTDLYGSGWAGGV